MKIVVLTALWKRPEIASLMLSNLQQIRQELEGTVDLEVLAVGSEGAESARLAGEHGALYVEHQNQPLGAKWNVGLIAVQPLNPDAVLVFGSDNFPDTRLIYQWAEFLWEGYDYLGFLDAYIMHVPSWRMIRWFGYHNHRRGESIGSGRCYSRRLLDRAGWSLWNGSLQKGLDWSVTQKLSRITKKQKIVTLAEAGGAHLGLKTAVNVCSFASFLRDVGNYEVVLPEEVLPRWYSRDISDRILALRR